MGSFGKAGASAVAGGMAATGEAALAGAGRAAVSPLRKMADKAGQALRSNFRSGARSSFGAAPEGPAASTAAAPAESGAGPASSSSGPPSWAKAMKHRSEEHTSELQSLMRISYAVFCLKKKTTSNT